MEVTASADLLHTPVAPAGVSAGSGFSLHVSTRLVDIGVTARDKKGRPITGLTQEDFKVYDNGKEQNLRSFSHARTATADLPIPAAAAQEVLYSNRLVATGSEQSAGTSVPENSTIILLDTTSLSFGDFTRARERILSFLDRLPSSEAVGLYVRAGYGFRVLGEGTANHAALSSALRGWIPNAQDLARAQEEEMRNRQQFDTVQSPADMQYVNGNIGGTANIASVLDIPGGGADTTSDPKLMKEGSDPTREALIVVVGVAAHLGVIPGHKNLVWVASDNVLANWTDQAAGSDRDSKTIGTFAMRTQEVLNDAHVSLYPLAASELETAATDASLQNDSVQLDPSVADMYPKASLGDAAPLPGARAKAEMRQDVHPVQAAIQQLAQGTGGRTFNRSDNVAANLNSVIEDGEATYLLSFAPETAPDDQYHQLRVSVPTRGGIVLRYRSGYLYSKEPSTLKERFKEAMWQPVDATEIALSAHRASASAGAAVSLNIAVADISLAQQGERRTGKLDIFLVQRDQTGMRAEVNEQTLALDLKPATYEKVLREGIPFEQYFAGAQKSGTVRMIVVDETSGRIGTITLPAARESTGP
jgi:VWFA-related protein